MNEAEPKGRETRSSLAASPGGAGAANARPPVSDGSRRGRGHVPASASLSAAHLTERPERDRAEDLGERSSAEERDVWWHTNWGVEGDW